MDKYKALILDAFIELSAQKLRTFLTLLGMIFGVGAVIAMLNIGEGAEQQALKMIDSMGVNNLIVEGKRFSKEEMKEIRKDSLGLSLSDVEAASQTLSFVEQYSAVKNVKVFNLYSDVGKSDAKVIGVTPNYFELANLPLTEGRTLTKRDDLRLGQVTVLGADAAKSLFGEQSPIGQFVKVNHLWLQVVGVLAAPELGKKEFQGVKLGGDRNTVFIPLSTSLHKLNSGKMASQLDSFKLAISKDVSTVVAAKAVDQLLKLRHGGAEDYTITIPSELLAQQKQTQQIFNIVMACVAGISLLVGGIGIMNIMLANVLERTKEIGLLRAIGATKQNIKQQFIAESFVISLLGGVIGILFGLGLSELIGYFSDWAVSWSAFAIFLSLTICMVVGVVFGAYPAIKASQLNPIEALHSE